MKSPQYKSRYQQLEKDEAIGEKLPELLKGARTEKESWDRLRGRSSTARLSFRRFLSGMSSMTHKQACLSAMGRIATFFPITPSSDPFESAVEESHRRRSNTSRSCPVFLPVAQNLAERVRAYDSNSISFPVGSVLRAGTVRREKSLSLTDPTIRPRFGYVCEASSVKHRTSTLPTVRNVYITNHVQLQLALIIYKC